MKVVGLESTAEQAKSIETISLKDQAGMLLEFVDAQDPERVKRIRQKLQHLQEDMVRLENAYLDQNLDSLNVMMGEMDEMMPDQLDLYSVTEQTILSRENLLRYFNRTMYSALLVRCTSLGSEGMIAMLKKRGYKVEPVKFTFTESKLKLD